MAPKRKPKPKPKGIDLEAIAKAEEGPSEDVRLLRRENDRLRREVKRHRAGSALALDVLREALDEYEWNVSPPPPPKRTNSKSKETGVCVLSDLQAHKITPSYNFDVCRERMFRYVDKVIACADNHVAPVEHLHALLGGDMIEGEVIFPGQMFEVNTPAMIQACEVADLIAEVLNRLSARFSVVEVDAAYGNHGRVAPKSTAAPSNWDAMVYAMLERALRGHPRIKFNRIDSWYSVARVNGWGFLLVHGDQIKGQLGIPLYGVVRAVHGWSVSIGQSEPWDYLVLGHFHVPASITVNSHVAYINGTVESGADYALRDFKSITWPQQRFFTVHKKHGITSEHTINLGERLPMGRWPENWKSGAAGQ